MTSFNIKRVDMQVNVSKRIGFNVDNSSLFFGSVPPGASAVRNITLIGNGNSKVFLRVFGTLRDWISFSDNNILLDSGKKINISITLRVPENTPYREYQDRLWLFFWKR